MAEIRLYALGPPRVERDGQRIDLGLRKALALIIYLAVTAQPHARDHLATLLWPESDQREARGRLRRTIYELGVALGDDVLLAEGDTLRLNLSLDLWLDCAVFQEHIATGLPPTLSGTLGTEQMDLLAAAADLYSAEFLAGFTLPDSPVFDEWQFFQREHLRQRYAQTLQQLVRVTSAQQHWDQAIDYARRWLALDTLHEPAHQLLMHLYASAGQHAAALRQYQDCVRILESELGQPPDDETTTLYEAIRTRQLHQQTTGATAATLARKPYLPAEPPARSVAPALLPDGDHRLTIAALAPGGSHFVARQRELGWLEGLLHDALDEHGSVGLILGEAGQGKTTLLRAFAAQAHAAHGDLVILWGACNAYTSVGDPYLPFREILDMLTGRSVLDALTSQLHDNHAHRLGQLLPATMHALVEVGPDLIDTFVPARQLLDRATALVGEGESWVRQLRELTATKIGARVDLRQQELFEHYARVILTVARWAPLLIILDDLQWADRGSADLLLHLGRRLIGSRVLIVGAYRPADVAIGRDGQRHPLELVISELQREFGPIRLDLALADGRPLVDALLDAEPNRLDETFRVGLYRQTAGHPLFTVELLRDMRERGELAQDGEGRWTALPALQWASLPARVEGVIGERVGRLDPRLREVLQIASVEGEEFTVEVVAHVLGVEQQELVRRLSRELGDRHHLVQALDVRRDEGLRRSRYRFQHILIQRYLYQSMDEVQRSYEHEAVGYALEALYGTRSSEIAAELARHFAAAQLAAKAVHYHETAGDQARRAAAFEEAIRSYRGALEAAAQSDPSGRARVSRKLGECLWMTSRLQEAFAAFETCRELSEVLDDWEGAGAALRTMGRMYWEQGDRVRSLEHYHRALALLEQKPESVEQARAISSISQMHMLASHYQEAISWGERALALARRLKAHDVVAHALNNVGVAYSSIGHVQRGEALLRESLRLALDQNLPHDTCRAYRNLATVLIRLSRYAEARASLEELQPYALRVQAPVFIGTLLVELAGLDWLIGRWQEGLARRSEIREWIERSQSIAYLEVIASNLFGSMLADLGQPDAAYTLLAQASSKARSQAELQTTGPHLAQTARVLALLGRDVEAGAVVRELLDLIASQPNFQPAITTPLIALCRLLADHLSPELFDAARAISAILEHAAAEIGSAEIEAAAAEARGAIAAREGELVEAVAAFRHAADAWQAIGRPYDRARALAGLGCALRAAGELRQAGVIFNTAHDLIVGLAENLADPVAQEAFLRSSLAQAVREGRIASEVQHPNPRNDGTEAPSILNETQAAVDIGAYG